MNRTHRSSASRRLRVRVASAIVSAAIALSATVAFAADDWVLTTVDFNSQRTSFTAIDARQVRLGDQKQLPLDRFLQIRRISGVSQDASSASSGRLVARLIGGDRIIGIPVGTTGESVRWQSPTLGELKLPIKKLYAIEHLGEQRALNSSRDSAAPATDDVVHLSNGDLVRGVVAEISTDSVSVQPTGGGDPTPVPLSSVTSLTFANAMAGAPSTRPASTKQISFCVTLIDSTAITCEHILSEPGGDQISLFGLTMADKGDPARVMPLSNVASIEQINGPIVWLSSLSPSENVQTSYLDLDWPARFDRSVSGAPIRFGDQTFVHGIGVHSYSRLAFAIDDPSYQTFRTQYAIDGIAPLADVTVRIKFDGKVVHEQQHVRREIALSPAVTLPLNGAKSITLEVDYGENQDVQDRLNWIEPALLRFKSAATTQPVH